MSILSLIIIAVLLAFMVYSLDAINRMAVDVKYIRLQVQKLEA